MPAKTLKVARKAKGIQRKTRAKAKRGMRRKSLRRASGY